MDGLKETVMEQFDSWGVHAIRHSTANFVMACKIAYTTVIEEDEGLRNLISQTLHEEPSSLERKPILDLLKTIPDVAFDLLMFKHRMDHVKRKKPKK